MRKAHLCYEFWTGDDGTGEYRGVVVRDVTRRHAIIQDENQKFAVAEYFVVGGKYAWTWKERFGTKAECLEFCRTTLRARGILRTRKPKVKNEEG